MTIGSWLPGNGGYHYSDGQDRGQFIDSNVWKNPKTGYGAAEFANPVGGVIDAVRGWAYYNSHNNRNDLTRLMAQQNADRQSAYDQRGALLDQMRGQQDAARGTALANLQQSYGNRAGSYQQAYDSQLNDALAGAQQQYRQGMQDSSLALAARGQLGSSSDYENQAAQANRLNSAVMAGQANASQYAQNLRDTDFQQMDATRRALLAGDPQSAAAFQGAAANAAQQGARYGDLASLADRQRMLNQMGSNNLSQAVGNLGQAGAYYVQSGNYGSWPNAGQSYGYQQG